MGKIIKWLDFFAAMFLLLFFPATWLHVKMRDRFFEACVQRVAEYGEMLEKQGYLSVEVARTLLCGREGLLDRVELTLWEEGEDGKRLLTLPQLEDGTWNYMGEEVYPFSDGMGLLFVLQMEADGLERAYYSFCGKAPVRERACYFVVRDGLRERRKEGTDEAIPLFHTIYDPVCRDCVDAVCARENTVAPDVGTPEDGQQCGHRGGPGRGGFGGVQ